MCVSTQFLQIGGHNISMIYWTEIRPNEILQDVEGSSGVLVGSQPF